jgi:predicted DNA-binding transcriptional regulator AlpA
MKILRKPAVLAKTGLSYPTIYRKMQAGDFPQPVQLGPNSVGWIEEEIDAWSKSLRRGPIPFETLNAPQRYASRKSNKLGAEKPAA